MINPSFYAASPSPVQIIPSAQSEGFGELESQFTNVYNQAKARLVTIAQVSNTYQRIVNRENQITQSMKNAASRKYLTSIALSDKLVSLNVQDPLYFTTRQEALSAQQESNKLILLAQQSIERSASAQQMIQGQRALAQPLIQIMDRAQGELRSLALQFQSNPAPARAATPLVRVAMASPVSFEGARNSVPAHVRVLHMPSSNGAGAASE